MSIKRSGSTTYGSRSNSDDKQRRQLAKHPIYGKSYRENMKTKPNVRTKSKINLKRWERYTNSTPTNEINEK